MRKCLDASGIASNRRKSHIRFICVFCASLWLKNSARKAVSALCLCLCLFVFRPLLAQSIPVAGNGALMSRERKRFNPRINVYSTETEVRSRSSCSTPMVVCSKYGDLISEATRVMLGNEEVSMPPRNGFGKDGLEITK